MFKVELLSLAENELADAYDWYEQQQTALGNRFYKEINYHLEFIENNPYLFPVKYTAGLRVIALNKFPYLIIYWVDEVNLTVFVVSIFHTSRKPKYF